MSDFLVANWYLFILAIGSGALLLWPKIAGGGGAGLGGGTRVSPNDAVMLINREKAVLIDVSEPAEYAALHATGSRSVPFASLEQSKDLPKELPKNKALPIVVVCPTGSRASRAVAALHKLGFENAKALAGGLAAWRAANLPVEKSAA
jgi:rhodanese-related sulfurtransferase